MKKDPLPPRFFLLIFRWFCRRDVRDSIEGDLIELYNERVNAGGKVKAGLQFIRDVFLLCRPEILRSSSPSFKTHRNSSAMIKNYFKTGWRNIIRHKSYAALNITGLAIGIAACMLIFLVVQFETSFDNFHKNPNRIFRVVAATKTPDGINYKRSSAFPVANGLKIDYPELGHVARLWIQDGNQVTVVNDKMGIAQKKFKEDYLFFADPEFFDILNFPFLVGNRETALTEPNTVVLTQETAEKYFGDWHLAMNQSVRYNNNRVCKVTGVLQNTPANTDFPLQVVFSFKTSPEDTSADWVSQTGNLATMIVLPENKSAGAFNKELERFVKKHTPDDYANQGYILQPLNDIHYNTSLGNFRNTFSKELITTISLVGIFLLVIACVNFVNLSTAQAVNRSKEVGVRKVLGSSRKQLIIQFLSETFIITFVSVLLAIVIVVIMLPFLNSLLQTTIKLRFDFSVLLILLTGMLSITLLSGIYPAIILSGFRPITVLKSKFSGKWSGGFTMRRVLVVLQFTIAQVLIIGTLVVVKQMNYFRNTSMGFDKDAIVTVPVPDRSGIDALKIKLLAQPGIKNVSLSAYTPSDNSHWGSDFRFDGSLKNTDFSADLKWADADYFKMYGIKFVAGSPYHPADSVNGFVINKMLAKKLGFEKPADILGKKIDFWEGAVVAPIVGVVDDFHGTTLAKQMKPVILGSYKDTYQLINIKLETGSAKQTLVAIEKLWNNNYPDYVYEYQFLDDKIKSFYRQEEQVSQLYKSFAAIAVFISCLGLYGLISFMAVQRTKEVGIRKVLGASVGHILYLFSKEFTGLIILAFAIAAPLAGYFMQNWLQNFAYRTNIGTGVFIVTVLMAVLIAWMTVGYLAVKAARANPVKSLRSE